MTDWLLTLCIIGPLLWAIGLILWTIWHQS